MDAVHCPWALPTWRRVSRKEAGTPLGMEWAWLLPAICAGAFVAITLVGRWLPGRGAPLAIAAVATAFALFWFVANDVVDLGPGMFERTWFQAGDAHIALGMTVDQLAVIMLGLVTAVSLAVQVYSLAYMRGDSRFGWYFAVHSLFAASMLGLVLADNLLVFYVVWELVGLCSYLLIGFWWERRSAAEAAKKAFITTRIGDVALLSGILLLFKVTGTFELSEIFRQASAGEISHTAINLSTALIFVGAAGKSAQFPFHVWLPDAMEGPTPVSALIHAATMVVAGVYVIARMAPLLVFAPGVLDFIAYTGLVTAFLGGVLALVQNDLKRALAYSTISQLGFMMLALGGLGFTAGIFHLLAHAFFKALLFLGAGSIIHAMHEEQDMRKMGGLSRRLPVTYVTFVVASFALIGLFPMSGFFSKDEILVALNDRNSLWFVAGLAASALTALYTARMLFMAFSGKPRSEAAERAHESPITMLAPMAALAVPAAGLGLLALPWLDFDGIGSFLFFPPGGAHGYEFTASVFWPSLVVAWAMFILGRALFVRGDGLAPSLVQARFPTLYRALEQRLYFDHVYQWVVDHVVLVFSRFIALFDRHVVNDTAVDGVGKATALSARLLRYHQTGLVSNYVLAVAVSLFIILLIVITTRT